MEGQGGRFTQWALFSLRIPCPASLVTYTPALTSECALPKMTGFSATPVSLETVLVYILSLYTISLKLLHLFKWTVSVYKQLVQTNSWTHQQGVQGKANNSQSTANVTLSVSRSFYWRTNGEFNIQQGAQTWGSGTKSKFITQLSCKCFWASFQTQCKLIIQWNVHGTGA